MWLKILYVLGLTNLSKDQVVEYENSVKNIVIKRNQFSLFLGIFALSIIVMIATPLTVGVIISIEDYRHRLDMHAMERLQVVEQLIAALDDPNKNVQQSAVQSLEWLRSTAKESLITALGSSNENVRQSATQILVKLLENREFQIIGKDHFPYAKGKSKIIEKDYFPFKSEEGKYWFDTFETSGKVGRAYPPSVMRESRRSQLICTVVDKPTEGWSSSLILEFNQ